MAEHIETAGVRPIHEKAEGRRPDLARHVDGTTNAGAIALVVCQDRPANLPLAEMEKQRLGADPAEFLARADQEHRLAIDDATHHHASQNEALDRARDHEADTLDREEKENGTARE